MRIHATPKFGESLEIAGADMNSQAEVQPSCNFWRSKMETSVQQSNKMIEIANALTLQTILETYLKCNKSLSFCGGGRWR